MSGTRISRLWVIALIVIVGCSLSAHAKYGGGSGEPNDPYLIYDANHMQAIGADSNDWDKCFKLIADIDLSSYTGTEFNIIGTSWDNTFTGVFDGNGHTISNFSYTSTDTHFIGLFGYVMGEIKDLGMIDPNVDAGTGEIVGSLVGRLWVGTITNCYVHGGSVSGDSHVGGLVGGNSGTITNCYSKSSVSGIKWVGGIVGYNGGTISNCHSTGSVSGYEGVGGLVGENFDTITNCCSSGHVSGDNYVGGLVGWNADEITNCYAAGSVSGTKYVGGLVGKNGWWDYVRYWPGVIVNSYSSGSVTGENAVGGLVGYNEHGEITNSFWDIETSGWKTSHGGIGKTTSEMQTASSFVDWWCESAWTIDEGFDYPRLVWENKPGEIITAPSDLYGGGIGEPNDPYLIYTAEHLSSVCLIACEWDKHFKLMTDIDLDKYTKEGLNVIGTSANPFTGVFDGNGHTVSNLTCDYYSGKYRGLFGYVNGGEILNLGMIEPDIDAGTGYVVGSLVGYSEGTITNCYAEGSSVSGVDRVGGLVGCNSGTITNCYSTGSVSGDDYVGGLVGYNDYGTINNCYSTGSVAGDNYVGGPVGYNDYGTINNCYSMGSVSGDDYVGGMVGNNYHGTITNCYSTGSVAGSSKVGGLVGYNMIGTITNSYSSGSVFGTDYTGGLVGSDRWGYVSGSYWDIESSGQSTSAGGTGKTTSEMQTASTFVGWWCEHVWTIDEGVDYPRLWWENMPGEIITAPSVLYGGGIGETNDPYLIYTAEQLSNVRLIACDWDKHFKLMADIDLAGYTKEGFNVIGTSANPFTGVFDGNGHTVSNFLCHYYSGWYRGLFGYVNGGEILNLGLIDPNVAGRDIAGSLVGYMEDGTIVNCYAEGGSVVGYSLVGGLVGWNQGGTLTGCYATGSVEGDYYIVGGLVGYNLGGTITNCYATGSIYAEEVWEGVGGLVGYNNLGTITNCYATGCIYAEDSFERTGGLVGFNREGTITNCYSTGSIYAEFLYFGLGGLVGLNYSGTITNCYATGSIYTEEAWDGVGGLVGYNYLGTITNCYATGSNYAEEAWDGVGGLVGRNSSGTITNCYSTGSVLGVENVGGLVGGNYGGEVTNSFWDIQTSGQTTSDGGTGKITAELQMASTFTDAGWDFTTPVWTIDEGVDYPRLWWELVPVLHAEPEVTLGTSNIISWDPVPGANDYYAECSEDENFTSIIYNSGWITETSCEFTGLQMGQQYWYSVKARNSVGIESQWSNVESSLQCTLADVVELVETLLTPESLKNRNMKNALLNKIDAALKMIEKGNYTGALSKLRNDILQKTNGCGQTGQPDKNDWIITCEQQSEIYPLIIETIEHVKGLMGE